MVESAGRTLTSLSLSGLQPFNRQLINTPLRSTEMTSELVCAHRPPEGSLSWSCTCPVLDGRSPAV